MSTKSKKPPIAPSPFAVRWMQKKSKRTMFQQWSKWHWTINHVFTHCGHIVPIANKNDGPLFPETDERQEKITCALCKKKCR